MIETVLVLGVTGALTIAIIIGSSATVGQQRYRDTLNSLKATIQYQFSIASNPTSSRSGAESCSSAVITSSPVQPRGTSECLLLGRLITVDATGKQLRIADVIGERSPTAPEELAASDIAELGNYRIAASPIGVESSEVAWDGKLVKSTSPYDTAAVSILIIRSPLSGSIMTYTSEGVPSNLVSMITAANMSSPRILCVEAAAGSFVGNRMGVKIGARASSQGAVEIPNEQDRVCG